MNKHLNIFHHYSHNGTTPIENNISRGLAINLQENPGLLSLLIESINEKIKKQNIGDEFSLTYPEETFEIGFQIKCKTLASDYSSVENIIGISLTAAELPENEEAYVDNNDERNRITDITIFYDDTLIVIEVKRNETDCRNQLNEQMNQIVNFCLESNETNEGEEGLGIIRRSASFSWNEVMRLVDRYISLSGSKADRIIKDYRDEIERQFPTWIPQKPLSKLTTDKTEEINSRIGRIKTEYLNTYGLESVSDRRAIPLDYGWARELNIEYENAFFDAEGNRAPYVIIGIWPSDTCRQYWSLKSFDNTYSFFTNRYKNILYNDTTVGIRITPYIKFAHYNGGKMWVGAEESNVDNRIPQLILLSDQITRKWRREQWENLKQTIVSSGYFSENTISEFLMEFNSVFEDSGRNYVTVSVGFEVKAYISFELAQQMDDAGTIVSYIHGVTDVIKNSIEGVNLLDN